MKRLIAAMVIGAFAASSAFATSTTDYTTWSTAQLQQKRIELYKTVPYRGNRKGVAVYVHHAEPLPQEDEIKKIEQELNRRKTAGDKAAYFEATPNYRRHKNPEG